MARRPSRYSGTVQEQIAAAFRRRLQFRNDLQELHVAAAVLADLAVQHPPGDARPFQRVGVRKTRLELQAVARAVAAGDQQDIVEACAALHAPAIDALANAGATRGAIVQSDPAIWPVLAELIDKVAATVVTDDPIGGRPTSQRARVVARVVLFHFERLATPEDNDRIVRLVGDVFRILGIREDARSIITELTDSC